MLQCPAIECKPLQRLLAEKPGRLPNGVPMVIHQTWKDDQVPDHWLASKEAWTSLHPDWLYLLWTDADIKAYIQGLRPQAWALFERMEYPIQRVDLWRYFVLHDFGGVYSDLDIMPVKSITEPLGATLGSVFLVNSANTTSHYTNALMASAVDAASRAFWASVVDRVATFPRNWTERLASSVRHLHVIMSTGPMALTGAATHGSVPFTVLPRPLWNPYDLSLAGDLQAQERPEALVKILQGSSWHAADSSIVSFAHVFKVPLLVLVGLCVMYYVIGAQLLARRFKALIRRTRSPARRPAACSADLC